MEIVVGHFLEQFAHAPIVEQFAVFEHKHEVADVLGHLSRFFLDFRQHFLFRGTVHLVEDFGHGLHAAHLFAFLAAHGDKLALQHPVDLHEHILGHGFQPGQTHKHLGPHPGGEHGQHIGGLIRFEMPQNKSQGLRMFAAQKLGQQARADAFEFAEGHGPHFKVEGVHDVFGRFAVQIGGQHTFGRILPPGHHVHARHQRGMKLAQHLFHGIPGHGFQFHNRLGNSRYLTAIHALENVRREFVAKRQQQYGDLFRALELHACHSSNNAFASK